MSELQRIPVTEALKANYTLLRGLVGAAGLDWIVVRTNPNCEQRALESLTAAGLLAWLPMVPMVRKNSRTKNEFDRSRPMCTRYLFVGLDRSARQSTGDVVVCDGVEAVLSFDPERRPHIVPARQMQILVEECWQALTRRKYVQVQSFDIGMTFRLLADEFKGCPGEVTGYDKARGIIEGKVQMFGREHAVRVAVDKVAISG
ncbi:transcriptional activator RfaH [Roseibium album]|nr:transcriptional activator RfaH [Roseibium album]